MRLLTAAAALVTTAVLALGACADGRVAGSDARTYEHPTGADDVVLSIATAGGLLAPLDAFAEQPQVWLLGDGRLVLGDTTGLRETRLAEPDVQALLRLADDAGLLAGPPDYEPTGNALATDGPTTSVVLRADGGSWTHAAYGLGTNGGAGGEDGARARLDGFVTQVADRLADAPTTAYDATAVRLRAERTQGATGPAWPAGPVDLADATGCVVVEGAAAAEVLRVVGEETAPVLIEGGQAWRVAAVAVLPGEATPCAGWTGR